METLTKEKLYDLYWNQGLSSREIAKMHGISYKKVLKLMRKFGIPRREPNNPYTKEWWKPEKSPELAYVIGVIVGDGNADIGNNKVTLGTKDIEFAEAFKNAIEKIGLHVWIRWRKDRKRWVVTCQKQEFARFLKQFKEVPRKILEWVVSEDEKRMFIRGFYDSEGSITLSSRGNIQYRIYNTNLELLEICQKFLTDLGIESKMYVVRKKGDVVKLPSGRTIVVEDPEYVIVVSNQTNIQKFETLIGSSIPRKLPNEDLLRRAEIKRKKKRERQRLKNKKG
jgi:intein-encoded DNA endonuclease-like protein